MDGPLGRTVDGHETDAARPFANGRRHDGRDRRARTAERSRRPPPLPASSTSWPAIWPPRPAATCPPRLVEHTKHHILDTFAAMISGAALPPGRVALAFARARAGERVATVAASDMLCGPIEAAMANGMLAHSDETDDSHAPSHSHPGCSVVPAALAAGEQFGIDGTRLLRAVALGYDIGARVTFTLGGLPFQIETHHSSHSIAGDFGAAAAAACAAGLSARQMRWVLDYAAQQASGIAAWQRDTEHIEKSLVFGGFPARNGVSAVLLIQLGGTGVEDILSGPDNFLTGVRAEGRPGPARGQARRALRGDAHEHQEMDGRIADSGAARRDREPAQAPAVRRGPGPARRGARGHERSQDRERPRNARHLPAAHGGGDARRQDRVVRGRARQAAHAGCVDPAAQRAKVQLVPDEDLERLYPRREAIVEITLHRWHAPQRTRRRRARHHRQSDDAGRSRGEGPRSRDAGARRGRPPGA